MKKNISFTLESPYTPSGDQPQAIEKLYQGLRDGLRYQTLLGVTGSGKTFTMAQVIAKYQKPTLILAPNKTLAAQLYGEMKAFFPKNAVEYFVSYYDYYQPEAYVPSRDLYIEKDASINEQIEQMRLSATRALFERNDVIIVATVSAIYGLGDPGSYFDMAFDLECGMIITQRSLIMRLIDLQYLRNDAVLKRGSFRVRGETIDLYPSEQNECALRIELDDREIVGLKWIDALTGRILSHCQKESIYPQNHYVTPKEKVFRAIETIQQELMQQLQKMRQEGRLVEAQRLEYRTLQDIEFLRETGHCQGIENYSSHLNQTPDGLPPSTLLSYFQGDHLIFCDESHLMLPQIGAMFHGDRSRKENLVQYGFRLPSCLNNRPLTYDEFEAHLTRAIFVSATPGPLELKYSQNIAEQIVRPTGLCDPMIEVRPVSIQVSDIHQEIIYAKEKGQRVMITTLTKKMSEDLSAYLIDLGVAARYLHSDLDAQERLEALKELRTGDIDVLIGINLLREGLDLPEVAVVGIFDADKEGFLRSARSLIQTIGRAARHHEGRVFLYADKITSAMRYAIDETQRRREKQVAYNLLHGITPKTISKPLRDIFNTEDRTNIQPMQNAQTKIIKDHAPSTTLKKNENSYHSLIEELTDIEEKMHAAAALLEFEKAAEYRNQRDRIKKALGELD
ncbi:MAG: excinuclease ABC subunit UvrB [Gammaproteobacteria bacterium]|nr:excinuclease ABC subunit UvrB [Gammaproteobacteria bacterium]